MSRTPQAFVVEPCNVSTSAASQYGEVRFIWDHDARRPSIWDAKYSEELVQALKAKAFDPKIDFLVIAGHMVTLVLAVSTLQSCFGAIRVLFWSSTEQRYVVRLIGDTTYGCPGCQDVHDLGTDTRRCI